MNTIMDNLTEWLTDNLTEWKTNEDGSIQFELKWGDARYFCTFGVDETTLKMVIEWTGTFGPAVTKAIPIMRELSASADRGQLWINPQTGGAIFRTGVIFDPDRELDVAAIDRVLDVTFDVFNLMILATKQVIVGSMTQRNAVKCYMATLFKMYGTEDADDSDEFDDEPPADPTPTIDRGDWSGSRPYRDDDSDPMLN